MVVTLLWSALAGYAGYRALVRPHRAVVVDGVVARCSGTASCDTDMVIQTAADQRILTPTAGRVLVASGSRVLIATSLEPVLLDFGQLSRVLVAVGQHVRAGETIGVGPQVSFGVKRIERDANGQPAPIPLIPSAWLASRGMRASAASHASGLWCAQGRRLSVPAAVAKCNMRLPEPAQLSLLPVSVQMQ